MRSPKFLPAIALCLMLAFLVSACGGGDSTSPANNPGPTVGGGTTTPPPSGGGTQPPPSGGGTTPPPSTGGNNAIADITIVGGEQRLWVFHLDVNTGESDLTQEIEVPGMIERDALATSADGRFVLASSDTFGDRITLGEKRLQLFSVDAATRKLTLSGEMSEHVPSSIDRLNSDLFVGNEGNSVSTYRIVNGQPAFVSSFPVGGVGGIVAVNSVKSVVYAKAGNTLRALHVDANGNLFDLGSIEDFSTYIVIDPQNRFLFTNGSSNTIGVYKIADSGAIGAKVGTFQVLPAFNTVFGFVADRTGSFLFIPGNDRIVTERINPDGSLAEASVLMHDFSNIPPADSMAVEPGNRQVVFDWFTSTDPKEIFTLGISSDGKLLATSHASNTGNFGIRGEVDGPGW